MARRSVVCAWAAWALLSVVAACGGEDPVEVDPAVAPFVGTWDADSLTLTNAADTMTVANVLDTLFNGSFFITVEPSGQYTANLTVLSLSSPEIGQLAVIDGSTLTLTPTVPPGPVATAEYLFAAEDSVILDGTTEFDFNLDGTPELALAHFELKRR
jgi:hypothetical protein